MTNASPQQLALIAETETPRVPYHDLPARPYANKAPRVKGSSTSIAAADALEPKLGNLQRQVLLALDHYGPLTDEALDRVCKVSRPLRPRRRELELAGFVIDTGDTVQGESGLHQKLWGLTPKGERQVKELKA